MATDDRFTETTLGRLPTTRATVSRRLREAALPVATLWCIVRPTTL